MTLEELLDHLAVALDDDAELVQGPPDEQWAQPTLVRYLNDAQNIFCRKAWPIIDDSTVACCSIALVVNDNTYSLHKSVMRVLSVTPADSQVPLVWLNFNQIAQTPYVSFPDYYAIGPLPFTETTGRPGWYTTDNATKILRVRQTPNAQAVSDIVTLNLRIARLPLVALSVALPENEPEIPEEYHLDLCDYAAGRALMQANVDSDAYAQGKDLVASFYAKLRAARNDRLIAQNAPGSYLFGAWARTSRY